MDRKIRALHKNNLQYRYQANTNGRRSTNWRPMGYKKKQKSDKISFGVPERRRSKLSQKENLIRTATQLKPIN